jgi:uracil-DNA glycosylase
MKASEKMLRQHVADLLACQRCPKMHKPVVSGGPVYSKVVLVGQAPGVKEPILGRPFAWTAGKTLFQWFESGCGITQEEFRSRVYMAAVCRCFPGKTAAGGDRVPDAGEIANCMEWLRAELEILQPSLVIAVGKLAIQQFLPPAKLTELIGKSFRIKPGQMPNESGKRSGKPFDLIPLPHPSGASPWHRMEPGKSLLREALKLIASHPAFLEL